MKNINNNPNPKKAEIYEKLARDFPFDKMDATRAYELLWIAAEALSQDTTEQNTTEQMED